MTDDAQVYVQQVELALDEGADTAAPGAMVTVALCGHWDHGGACRWPHNNGMDATTVPAKLRVIFVARPAEADDIRGSIGRALREAEGWTVVSSEPAEVEDGEAAVVEGLLAAPRLG